MAKTMILLIDIYHDSSTFLLFKILYKLYALYSNQLLLLLYYPFNGGALVLLITNGINVAPQRPSPATALTTSLPLLL